MPTCPKDLKRNLEYRRKILELGNSSKSAREEIQIACARDPLWFANTWLWTFDPQNYPDAPERPVIFWPHQEEAGRRAYDAIGKHSLLFPKSRRMGVTTLILALLFHRWLFRPMQSFLLLSAKEDRVDKPGDPSCLMWKIDHMNRCLPSWLAAPMDRAKLRQCNTENGSVINGESTNSDADRGGVRTAVLADEVAAMPNGAEVVAAVKPLTNSLFLVSTPKGAYGVFYDLHEKWKVQAPHQVCRLHWTQHPRFSQGLYYDIEGKPRSPWYDRECIDAPGPRWIAQELDIAFNEAGGAYFEPALIERLLKGVRNPQRTGEIDFSGDGGWLEIPTGHLRLWCPLSDGANPSPPKGEYVIGADPSLGMGGEMGSNSAASIVERTSGQKVGEYANRKIPPAQFARYCVALAKWFHGAKLIWGCQGPGVSFGKTVTDDCRYYHIFYREDEEAVGAKRTRKTGYSEIGQSRQTMFDTYQDALHTGRFKNPSKEALEECRQFIISPTGSVEHSKALASEDPENKGKLHGDIVIADALANRLLPERTVTKEDAPTVYPKNSTGGRLQELLQNKRELEYY